ncbi:DUF4232 domain-containing protein [Streptomyces chartreusis]|uniref:DUF4232 domain-containing protein n=1 Tax=Streptomyces chartreusis TaxID=1969 RepID=UPI0033C02E6B
MPRAFRTAPVAVVGLLLLAACGTQSASRDDAAAGDDGRVRAEALCPSEFTRYGGGPTAEPSVAPSGTPTPLPLPSTDGSADGAVRVTALYGWGKESGCTGVDYSAEFEVANRGTEALTYTVTVGFLSAAGGAVDNVERIVEAVGPGRTVKGTVAMADPTGQAPEVTGAKVIEVRSVPVAEASSASGPCPASGVRVYADQGDAAMGLRAVGLHLVNCGTRPYRVEGYPELELLDEDHDTVDGVRILHGTDRISTGLGGDDSPRPVVLRPGEGAVASLAWRNTTGFGEAVNAPYARVRAKPGADPVTVTPEFDLGTTGKLGVGPWERDETYRAPATSTPRP